MNVGLIEDGMDAYCPLRGLGRCDKEADDVARQRLYALGPKTLSEYYVN